MMFFSTLFNAGPPLSGTDAASHFIQDYEQQYSNVAAPPFLRTSYKRAATIARDESKFLLVYLHSPLHQSTKEFCENTLSSPQVISTISDSFCLWGGSTHHSEPYMLMNEHLQPSCFPSLSVLYCRPDGIEYCVDKIEGLISATELTRRLVVLKAVHERSLENERHDQTQRIESTNLRNEQNIEFERAAEADRLKEANERAERLRCEEAEDEARTQAELISALELSKTLDKEATLKRKREKLMSEPPKGKDSTNLRLQLPNGTKLDRRFLSSSNIQDVRDFIDVYLGDNKIEMEEYSLSTNFPRKTYTDNTVTLQDAVTHT